MTATAKVLNWSAVEDYPAKRWWWFLGFGLVGTWLFVVAVLLQSWSHALLIGVIVPGLTLLYAQKARTMTYELDLDDETLTINDRDQLHLHTYRACTLDEPVNPKRDPSILLIPNRTLAMPIQLFLPDDTDEAMTVVDAISQSVPFDETDGYPMTLRAVDRAARWLKLR